MGLRLGSEDLVKLKQAFIVLDMDNDGMLDTQEIEMQMKKLSAQFNSALGKRIDWKKVMRTLDANNDEKISYGEFLAAAVASHKLLSEENLRSAFRILDLNGDGKISKQEL